MVVVNRGQTIEQRVSEDHPAVRIDDNVVNVNVAGHPRFPRYVDGVVALERLAGFQRVAESPDLIERADVDLPSGRVHPHGALQRPFEHGQPPVGLDADEKDLPRLIGGEHQTGSLPPQPGVEHPGRRHFDLWHIGRGVGISVHVRQSILLMRFAATAIGIWWLTST